MTELTIQERRQEWVKALRSGEYNQTTQELQNETGYCCLGVACRVYEKFNGSEALLISSDDMLLGGSLDDQQVVMLWLGLNDDEGKFNKGNLAKLNDSGATFAELADIIESEPEGLFND